MDTIQIKQLVSSTSTAHHIPTWRQTDTKWMLGLYGTAIGAGVLFLPINVGLGGLLPLFIMAIVAFPMTFFAHRGLCRFVLSSTKPGKDIIAVAEEHFGISIGKIITLLYFFAIYPILLVYSVAITNTVDSFIVHQLGISAPPRGILSFSLIIALMTVIHFGERAIVKTMSILVFPFVAALMLLAICMIPKWSSSIFENILPSVSSDAISNNLLMTVWLAIPVMVFAFNHSPIISAFAVAKSVEYGKDAEKKCSQILAYAHIMMVLTVMFFVFSCVMSLSRENLAEAKAQNISILSYLANHFNNPLMDYIAPIIAFVAITKSFLGHYLGAREGLNGLISQSIRSHNKAISSTMLNSITATFMLVTTWLVATINPSILGMIEIFGGPIIAILLFLMPIYAIGKVPAMYQYRGHMVNVFVIMMGVTSISATVFSFIC